MEIKLLSEAEIPTIASKIIIAFNQHKIFLFQGHMGAGKTTIIKNMCYELGVTDNVSSPTYSIVNEYSSPSGKVFHFDFYRIKSQQEALDLGIDEYLYSGYYCFIEWPDKIPDILPDHYLKILVREELDQSRTLQITEDSNPQKISNFS